MSFAERLRATRLLATKLAASELSELAGFSSAHVGHIESGRTKNASLASAAGIAAVLGVSVEYLFSGVGREPTAAQVNGAVARARAKRDGKPDPALADAATDEQTPAETPKAKSEPPGAPEPPRASQRSREEAATDPSEGTENTAVDVETRIIDTSESQVAPRRGRENRSDTPTGTR